MRISSKALIRFTVLLALGAALSAALVACGPQGPSASKPVELNLLDSFLPNLSEAYNVSLNLAIKAFETKHRAAQPWLFN